MQKRYTLSWTILLIALLHCSCNIDSTTDTIVVAEVEKEFTVDLWEEITPSGRKLQLKLSTINEQECSNASISYNLMVAGPNLLISINDIVEPDDCISQQRIIEETIEAGSLINGIYGFEIDLRDAVVNEGELSVNSLRYLLNFPTENGIEFVHEELRRVPQQTIWGYLSYPESSAQLARQAIEEITTITNPPTLQSGYYGYFTYVEGSDVKLTSIPDTEGHQTLTLARRLNNNQDVIQDIIHRYQAEYPEAQLEFFLKDGLGKVY